MKAPHHKTLSILLNVGIVLTACLLVYVLARNYYLDGHTSEQAAPKGGGPGSDMIGRKMPLNDAEWSKADLTLVIALSRQCEFCKASVPFYQKLAEAMASRNDLRTLVLLPEGVTDADAYVRDLGIKAHEIKKVSFGGTLKPFGITGVPAVLVVDREGAVSNVWVGQLTERYEAEVMRALKLQQGGAAGPEEGRALEKISLDDLKKTMAGRRVVVVDVRDREALPASRFPDAVNIPADELSSRAEDELKEYDLVVIFSYANGDQRTKDSYAVLKREGFKNVAELQDAIP